METKKDFDSASLLNDHSKDISGLGEKVGKCYSSERYEDFRDAVKKITLESMDGGGVGGGQEKIKTYATQAIKDYNRDDTWRKITFWVPIILSGVAIILAYFK